MTGRIYYTILYNIIHYTIRREEMPEKYFLMPIIMEGTRPNADDYGGHPAPYGGQPYPTL